MVIETPKVRPKENHEVTFGPPRRSRQLRGLLLSLSAKKKLNLAVKMAIRKIGKGLDLQNAKLVAAEARIEAVTIS